MIDDALGDLLERAGDATSVGPLPLAEIRAGATRRRRRRATSVIVAAAATVAVVAVASAAVMESGSSKDAPERPASHTGPSVPEGMRLVGLNGAAIAVPQDWGTNELRCGTPVEDTVIIDNPPGPRCGWAPQPDTESVEVARGGPQSGFGESEAIVIDGVAADRQPTACRAVNERMPLAGDPGVSADELCSGSLHIPSLDVSFRVTSMTSRATVDRLLEGVRITPDQVGVPGFNDIDLGVSSRVVDTYAPRVTAAGLRYAVRPRSDQEYPAGAVLDTEPAVGTLTSQGDRVTIVVSTGPDNEGLGVEPALATRQVLEGLDRTVVRSIDVVDTAGAGLEIEVEVDPSGFGDDGDASQESEWLARLVRGAVGALVHTDERTIGDVVQVRRIFARDPGGREFSELSGGGAVMRSDLQVVSPTDDELTARIHSVASRFGISVKDLRILHPLESAIDVTFTVPDSVMAFHIEDLRLTLEGTPRSIEGAFITLESPTGDPLLRSSVSHRTAGGELWFAPGQDSRFTALHSGLMQRPDQQSSPGP